MTADQTTVTVNLTPRSWRALEDAAAITGHTKTTTINRAIQLYLLVVGWRMVGRRIFVGRGRWRLRELTANWFNDGEERR
jgi:hypothetical protein